MFFSYATRPTYSSSGRSAGRSNCCRKRAPSPRTKLDAGRPVGSTSIGTCHAVVDQRVAHRRARRNQRRDIVALGQREATRDPSPHPPRQDRHVVVQVVLEERVIRRDHRQTVRARETHTRVVRDEWCVDMDQVDPGCELGDQRRLQWRPKETADPLDRAARRPNARARCRARHLPRRPDIRARREWFPRRAPRDRRGTCGSRWILR